MFTRLYIVHWLLNKLLTSYEIWKTLGLVRSKP